MSSLEQQIKERALALGFELVGIAAATPADSFNRLRTWLDQGFAGEMEYMVRNEEARRHPSSILPEVRSVVVMGMNHGGAREPQCRAHGTMGRVARYARSDDYHDVLRDRLKDILAWVREREPDCRGRAVVDTAPLLERDFARRAGLGWFGKNTMLLNKRLGSYVLLGALLLDLALEPDAPHETSHCGSCTACLEACPTQAFVGPGVLDARRCLSYLTIEVKGPVPAAWREAMTEWVFGCDVCQEVCPWNRKAPAGNERALRPRPDLEVLDLTELMTLSEEAFRRRFRGTALFRTRRMGLLRNAALILGNRGDPAALPALERALDDLEPVIRDAAAWAINRIKSGEHPPAAPTHGS
jgi:epoxyqueuosine reductase